MEGLEKYTVYDGVDSDDRLILNELLKDIESPFYALLATVLFNHDLKYTEMSEKAYEDITDLLSNYSTFLSLTSRFSVMKKGVLVCDANFSVSSLNSLAVSECLDTNQECLISVYCPENVGLLSTLCSYSYNVLLNECAISYDNLCDSNPSICSDNNLQDCTVENDLPVIKPRKFNVEEVCSIDFSESISEPEVNQSFEESSEDVTEGTSEPEPNHIFEICDIESAKNWYLNTKKNLFSSKIDSEALNKLYKHLVYQAYGDDVSNAEMYNDFDKVFGCRMNLILITQAIICLPVGSFDIDVFNESFGEILRVGVLNDLETDDFDILFGDDFAQMKVSRFKKFINSKIHPDVFGRDDCKKEKVSDLAPVFNDFLNKVKELSIFSEDDASLVFEALKEDIVLKMNGGSISFADLSDLLKYHYSKIQIVLEKKYSEGVSKDFRMGNDEKVEYKMVDSKFNKVSLFGAGSDFTISGRPSRLEMNCYGQTDIRFTDAAINLIFKNNMEPGYSGIFYTPSIHLSTFDFISGGENSFIVEGVIEKTYFKVISSSKGKADTYFEADELNDVGFDFRDSKLSLEFDKSNSLTLTFSSNSEFCIEGSHVSYLFTTFDDSIDGSIEEGERTIRLLGLSNSNIVLPKKTKIYIHEIDDVTSISCDDGSIEVYYGYDERKYVIGEKGVTSKFVLRAMEVLDAERIEETTLEESSNGVKILNRIKGVFKKVE
jgi:hypothetical protein